jgi:8-oxo-dGTP pyrophosphatase MutT (NUDIX family)
MAAVLRLVPAAERRAVRPEWDFEVRPLGGAPVRGGDWRPAAVLVALFPDDGELEVLLTRRSDRLPHHPGQVSFPGGACDPSDPSPLHTALREADEEIGLKASAVRVVGELGAIDVAASGFRVTPVVGLLEGRPRLEVNPAEVVEVLAVPLAWLRRPEAVEEETWLLGGRRARVRFFRWREHRIWGATARMLALLLEAIEDDTTRPDGDRPWTTAGRA